MKIEKGTDPAHVQIHGGRWDGAEGTVITRSAAELTVKLDRTDEVITIPVHAVEKGSVGELPRELGS